MSSTYGHLLVLPGAAARTPEVPLTRVGPWIRRALAGDRVAIRRLLEHVAPAVDRAVAGVLGARDRDRDDVVQEALHAFVRALPAFRGQCSVRGFSVRIATNLAFEQLRRRHRRERNDTLAPRPNGAPDPVTAVASSELLTRVRSGLLSLPPEQAEVVGLRWILGHSLAEIADITGAPSNTVRSRLRLARKALLRRLAPIREEDR